MLCIHNQICIICQGADMCADRLLPPTLKASALCPAALLVCQGMQLELFFKEQAYAYVGHAKLVRFCRPSRPG